MPKFIVQILKREKHWTLKFMPYLDYLGDDPAMYRGVLSYVYVDLRKTDNNVLWGGVSNSGAEYQLEDIDGLIALWQFVKEETEKAKQEFLKETEK